MNIVLSCIGRRGYLAQYFREVVPACGRIIGTSDSMWAPGLADCDVAVILPPISDNTYIDAVLAACIEHEATAILSLYDPDVNALSAHRSRFEAARIIPLMPDAEAVHVAFDKLRTHSWLTSIGIPTPATMASPSEAEEALATGGLEWPLIVKPRRGFGSANTFVVRRLEELRALFGFTGEEMIIQQYIAGEELNTDGLGDLEGRPIQIVAWRKLLSRLGETERAVTIDCPEVVDLASRMARGLRIVGAFDVDFIRDRHGMVWVIDVNLRFGGGYPVSHLAGAEFPRHLLAMLAGAPASPPRPYLRGVTMMKRVDPVSGPPA